MSTTAGRLRNYSGKNMIYSLLAVFALAFAVWALMPSPDSLMRRPVQVAPVAGYAAEQAEWPVWVPEGLEEAQWTPTTVNYHLRQEVTTWRMGWVTPSAEWIGLEQAGSPTQQWRDAILPRAERVGEVSLPTPDGQATWTRWRSGDETALVLEPPPGVRDGVTTIVHGTADTNELEQFVASLTVKEPSQR